MKAQYPNYNLCTSHGCENHCKDKNCQLDTYDHAECFKICGEEKAYHSYVAQRIHNLYQS